VRVPDGVNATYVGELSDFDVVGSAVSFSPTSESFVLRPRQRVLLVQSGALYPDERLVAGLGRHFEVAGASGVPTATLGEHGLRGAAERGSFDAVIAYWGALESRESANAGAAASWLPVLGPLVPDVDQRMRLRVRVVVLEVGSGRWRSLAPAPIETSSSSSFATRESRDRAQAQALIDAAVPAVLEAIEKELLRP
jgi:hypothetical protein